MADTKAATPEQSDAVEVADAQEQADFGAGFEGVAPPVKTGKSDRSDKPDAAATPRQQDEADRAELAQLTVKELAELKAAAQRTASYEQQFAKLFGYTGNIQKMLNEQQKATEKRRGELPRDEYEDLQRDYPEIAKKLRPVLERMNAGGATDADAARIESLVAQVSAKRELATLEFHHPNWREITGAVDVTQQQPDPNNAFRKWLASKDEDYQRQVNASESAGVIDRAIRTFQRETAAQTKPVTGTPRDAARADRIRSAVQPRGDGRTGAPAGGSSEQDEFEAGYSNAR